MGQYTLVYSLTCAVDAKKCCFVESMYFFQAINDCQLWRGAESAKYTCIYVTPSCEVHGTRLKSRRA